MTTAEWIEAEIDRIDRQRADRQKLLAERDKLFAEARKDNPDPWILAVTALLAVLAGIVARLPEIITALRVPA